MYGNLLMCIIGFVEVYAKTPHNHFNWCVFIFKRFGFEVRLPFLDSKNIRASNGFSTRKDLTWEMEVLLQNVNDGNLTTFLGFLLMDCLKPRPIIQAYLHQAGWRNSF